MAKFRLTRVLLVACIVVVLMVAPFAWMKARERQRLGRVQENIRDISDAIRKYGDKQREAEKATSSDATPVDGAP
jgi:hypothetical protein